MRAYVTRPAGWADQLLPLGIFVLAVADVGLWILNLAHAATL
jgi:hypothetical protein